MDKIIEILKFFNANYKNIKNEKGETDLLIINISKGDINYVLEVSPFKMYNNDIKLFQTVTKNTVCNEYIVQTEEGTIDNILFLLTFKGDIK